MCSVGSLTAFPCAPTAVLPKTYAFACGAAMTHREPGHDSLARSGQRPPLQALVNLLACGVVVVFQNDILGTHFARASAQQF